MWIFETLLTLLDSQMHFFKKELSVANQMTPSFSANHLTAVTGFLHGGAVYYFNGTDNPKTQSKLIGV
jgi:hypothetical protein